MKEEQRLPKPPVDGQILKTCACCNRQLPLDPDYFHRNASKPDGFHGECKTCRAVMNRTKKSQPETRKEVTGAAEQIQELEDQALDTLHNLRRASGKSTNLPHMSTSLEHILDVFGGSKGFAHHCVAEYFMAKGGSLLRQRFLSDILRLIVKVSESGAATVPLEHLSEEDLEREIKRRMDSAKVVESRLIEHEE